MLDLLSMIVLLAMVMSYAVPFNRSDLSEMKFKPEKLPDDMNARSQAPLI